MVTSILEVTNGGILWRERRYPVVRQGRILRMLDGVRRRVVYVLRGALERRWKLASMEAKVLRRKLVARRWFVQRGKRLIYTPGCIKDQYKKYTRCIVG